MITVKRKKDNRVVRAFTHYLADIPNGVTIKTADLTQKVLLEGTPIGKAENGLYGVVKTATLTAAATAAATTITVKKGHNFKAGDFVMLTTGGKAYAITAIAAGATDPNSDDITIETALGLAGKTGDVLLEAASQATGTQSNFKYQPLALTGDSYDVPNLSNLLVNAWTIASVYEANIQPLGAAIKAKLTGIQFI
ncbi:MAG: hypothetical protein LBS01_02365 [Prevotellaceae bacterium]|jgi:hypothetical protein|nr:hypothetical protein [Prevotellaceae bacterium]